MKIFFTSVADEILRAIRRAAEQQRTIERIELTRREWDELKSHVAAYTIYPESAPLIGTHLRYMGVAVVREETP